MRVRTTGRICFSGDSIDTTSHVAMYGDRTYLDVGTVPSQCCTSRTKRYPQGGRRLITKALAKRSSNHLSLFGAEYSSSPGRCLRQSGLNPMRPDHTPPEETQRRNIRRVQSSLNISPLSSGLARTTRSIQSDNRKDDAAYQRSASPLDTVSGVSQTIAATEPLPPGRR